MPNSISAAAFCASPSKRTSDGARAQRCPRSQAGIRASSCSCPPDNADRCEHALLSLHQKPVHEQPGWLFSRARLWNV